MFPDLEILQKSPTSQQGSQRVLVSIKPRAPAIKTIYIAEKSRFQAKKVDATYIFPMELSAMVYSVFTINVLCRVVIRQVHVSVSETIRTLHPVSICLST